MATRRLPGVGERARSRRSFTAGDVAAFAEVTGDRNPVHLDEEFAAHSGFGARIVHGMLTASLLSCLLGTELPGEGSIYLNQSLAFRAPIFLDEEVEASVEVTAVDVRRRRVTLATRVTKPDGTVAVSGEALILIE
ncbi:MAG: MaoC family dehydratase [Chloroflexota bacterium]|nr:MAG: MaoC family dehydratase [Chloroflexota bacterium]